MCCYLDFIGKYIVFYKVTFQLVVLVLLLTLMRQTAGVAGSVILRKYHTKKIELNRKKNGKKQSH